MSGVYTGRMSVREIQHALGVLERQHVARLLRAHARHVPLHASDITFAPEGVYVRGAFVQSLAACNECFPALTAARTDRTLHGIDLMLDLAALSSILGE